MLEPAKVILEIEKTCRTCLTEKTAEELTSIWNNNVNSSIRDVFSIELKANPILPSHICVDCLKTLNIARDFQKRVRDAEFQLKNLIVDEESNQVTVVYNANAVPESYVGALKIYIKPPQSSERILIVENLNIDVQNPKHEALKSGSSALFEHSEEICEVQTEDATGNSKEADNKWKSTTLSLTDNPIEATHGGNSRNTDMKIVQPLKDANFSCDLCSKTFRFEFTYKQHLLKHGSRMECESCLSQFDDATAYLFHVKRNHPGLKPFGCPSCPERFFTLTPLKVHFNHHSSQKQLKCDLCGRSFLKQSSLMAHQKKHTDPESFKCRECNKKLSNQHSLLNHLKIHQGDKRHKCETCGATFIHRFSLRTHYRTHTGEKPFQCKLCSNRFKTSSYLKIHMRTHTAEKPYQCTICPKSFVCKSALAAHEKAHTGEKKFQCDICGWRSGRSSDLQIHLRKHSGEKPYKCELCNKRYKTTSHLAAHRKTHSGLKEHVCGICRKAFGDPRTLKSHIRVHTGETPYMCHECGRRFKQSGQLSSHRKIHQNRAAIKQSII
ncbi:zinc finger protein OZF isoform X1 [Dendroctonus ponderosae]|uniref:zinc finger protein OZF isoform X1 n=1 Tax=Dendroctonus ponderosae TaxID=77166 RepID=UPI0020360652|nr:zinc finger protein OZF isoform X1 [Dendroctonus ponderosae]KAH1012199.1 hypothetical protein HUJ05_011395 [Dendroctonus ponderosae]